MGKVKSQLVWKIKLRALIGRMITVETHDGHYITDRLSDIKFAPIEMLGEVWDYPTSLVFNDHDSDGVPWSLIKSVRLAKRRRSAEAKEE